VSGSTAESITTEPARNGYIGPRVEERNEPIDGAGIEKNVLALSKLPLILPTFLGPIISEVIVL